MQPHVPTPHVLSLGLLPLLLLAPLVAQPGCSTRGHDLRAFESALKAVPVSHTPFCSEGRRPTCEECGYAPPRPHRRNTFKSRPKPPLTLELVLLQPGPAHAVKFLMRRAWEAVIYEHPMYERDCPTTSAPMWLIPDYLTEPHGRFWADFTWLTRQLHEGKIRIIDARVFQEACEWALQRLQLGIDAALAFAYSKLMDAGETGRRLLVKGVWGSLWWVAALVSRSAWGVVEWAALGVVATIVSLWTLVTTSIHFVLHAVLTIARVCVDVVLALLREMSKFLLWVIARTARSVADAMVGAIEAVVGGVVAFGIWMKEGAAAVRMAIYTLILDVLISIRGFFVDVSLLIWAFIVDTTMAVRQAGLDTMAAVATVMHSCIAAVTTGIHGAFGILPILVLPAEEAVDRALPWIITFISVSVTANMWWKERRERQQQQQQQQQASGRVQLPTPPPPPQTSGPIAAERAEQRVHGQGRAVRTVHMEGAVRTVHMEAMQTAPPQRMVVDEHDEVIFEQEGELEGISASPAPSTSRPPVLATPTIGAAPARQQPAAAEEPAVGVSEESEATKMTTRVILWPTTTTERQPAVLAFQEPESGQPQPTLRSVAVLFIRAALGEDDTEAAALRELVGPSYWNGMVALYRDDFARRGILTSPRDQPPFEAHGGLGPLGVDFLLRPPESRVQADKAWHLYGALKEAARRPGYTFV